MSIGSIHPDEERALCEGLSRFRGRVLIAPRYLNQVQRLYRNLGRLDTTVSLRSQPEAKIGQFVILDTVGELHAAYGLSEVAIVGGTFGKRNGQNLNHFSGSVLYGSRHAASTVDVLSEYGGRCCASLDEALERVSRRDLLDSR